MIVCPDVDTDPADEGVKPAFAPVVDGADQPAGTSTVTDPLLIPPVAAVYVNVNVRPVCPANVLVGETVIVPEPSADAFTVTEGELAIAVSVPPDVDFSFVVNVWAP